MNSIYRSSLIAVLFTVGLSLTFAPRLSAQGLVEACYTEKTGVIYLIDPESTKPGALPTECTKPDKHFRFSWTDAVGADHGALTGLDDDDHQQYLLVDGTRRMTGSLTIQEDADGIVDFRVLNRSTGSGSAERLSLSNEDGDLAGIQANDASSVYPNVMSIFNNRPDGSIRMNTGGVPKLVVTHDGDVGIGILTPTEKLSVTGVVESTDGGFKFPDGTTQTTAATGGGGILGWEQVQSSKVAPSGEVTLVLAPCSLGKLVLGGGINVFPTDGTVHVLESVPNSVGNGWLARVLNSGAVSGNVSATAICAEATP